MEQNVFDVLKERGFIEQTTHEAEQVTDRSPCLAAEPQ